MRAVLLAAGLVLGAPAARAAGYVSADIDCLDAAAAMHAHGDQGPAGLLYGFYLGRLNADGVAPDAIQRMMKSRALAPGRAPAQRQADAERCVATMNGVLKAMHDARAADDAK